MKINRLWRRKVPNGKKKEMYGGRLVVVLAPLYTDFHERKSAFICNMHALLCILPILVFHHMLLNGPNACFMEGCDWWLMIIFQDVIPKYPTTCAVEWVDAEDPLFLLYTSGSTGKPKVYMFHTLIHLSLLFFLGFF